MAAPAAAPGESVQDGVVANRIKDLERKSGEAKKKLNKVEADEKGTAQTPPTLREGEDAGTGILPKSGTDRIKDPVFRDETCEPFEGYEKPFWSMGETAPIKKRQESSMVDFDDSAIWETLLKQAEANLKQAEANRSISNAFLSQTQRIFSKEGIAAMEPGRLES